MVTQYRPPRTRWNADISSYYSVKKSDRACPLDYVGSCVSHEPRYFMHSHSQWVMSAIFYRFQFVSNTCNSSISLCFLLWYWYTVHTIIVRIIPLYWHWVLMYCTIVIMDMMKYDIVDYRLGRLSDYDTWIRLKVTVVLGLHWPLIFGCHAQANQRAIVMYRNQRAYPVGNRLYCTSSSNAGTQHIIHKWSMCSRSTEVSHRHVMTRQ